RKRGVLSRRGAAGSIPLVGRHRQVHAPREAETGNGRKRRSATQAHRYGVLGYKGARRKRLAHSLFDSDHSSTKMAQRLRGRGMRKTFLPATLIVLVAI